MRETDNTSRRQFLASSAAATTAACVPATALAQSPDYIIDPSDALDRVFGYGVGLDMTRQDLQQVA